jgi:hypothetical protein
MISLNGMRFILKLEKVVLINGSGIKKGITSVK